MADGGFPTAGAGKGAWPADKVARRPIAELLPYARNARTHSAEQVAQIAASIREWGWTVPVLVDETGMIIAGHGRVLAARKLGLADVPCMVAEGWNDAQKRAYVLADNKLAENAGWDMPLLAMELHGLKADAFPLDRIGFDADELADLLNEAGPPDQGGAGSLAERFGAPPFSVLDARAGWWQDRKRAWLALGIQSELGRADDATLRTGEDFAGKAFAEMGATSIFDPVLAELAYSWFCPPGGLVLDPFAGGSVRGIVASKSGRRYIGGELRAEQVAANRAQAAAICESDATPPEWREGDSRALDQSCAGIRADFIFSCPPYADLEVYSDDPADLSTMDYPAFRAAYREIIGKACALLKPDRFAAFVVGEARDKRGAYYGFVADTIAAFRDAGLAFYNEAILVTSVGTVSLRAGRQFAASRKLGKAHQNVLVFLKGDAKRAAKACGPVEFDEELFGEAVAGDEGGAPFAA